MEDESKWHSTVEFEDLGRTSSAIVPSGDSISKELKSGSTQPLHVDRIFTPALEDYIPLGCISWQIITPESPNVRENVSTDDWLEARDVLPNVLNQQHVWKDLVNLWRAAWVRVFRPPIQRRDGWETWRIYVLPEDVARSVIDRNRPNLKKSLDSILGFIDVAPASWTGNSAHQPIKSFDKWASGEDYSLFYLFNTLASPSPSVDVVKDRWSRASMKNLLALNEPVSGLQTELYPYQKRAAAEMLRREVSPQVQLDPRLEERKAPGSDQIYYYGSREGVFLRQPRCYDAIRGGILAETMGLGKTLICIALIIATKGHWPEVPPQFAEGRMPVRPRVGSLMQMAASTISRNPVPWRSYFDDIKELDGYEMEECVRIMENHAPKYEIPPVFVRSHRSSTYSSPSEVIQLCSTTIVVVPKNLMHQWRAELKKHVYEGALRLLVMEDRNMPLPPSHELAMYDVILFSRPRFENENKHADDFYESPLTKLHFLRIIIDEGHSFSSSNTHAAVVAEKLVRAERRWVVSGTPAKDLMGVEVDMTAMANIDDYEDTKSARKYSLEQRKSYNSFLEESSGAVKSLGSLASRFLKAQPWATSSHDNFEIPARWDDHVFRHESLSVKTYTSFSVCLRRTLENLVVKTQPEDVERDIELPSLTHKVIRLAPSFIDKLTANLFVLLFTTNAVTSERRDQDYLFHKNSQHHLHRLIANLRQSAFFWTGMQEEAVKSSLDVTWKYLDKKGVNCTAEDRKLLEDTAEAANVALTSKLWKATTETSDMGVFMTQWPEETVSPWAFNGCEAPMAMSLSLSLAAQTYVNNRLIGEEPTAGLGAAGEAAQSRMADQNLALRNSNTTGTVEVNQDGTTTSSGANHDSQDPTRLPAQGASSMTSSQISPKKSSPKSDKAKLLAENSLKPIKRRLNFGDTSVELPPDSQLGQTMMMGTTSSKFSYLIDRVMELHTTEKILIFYDGNHIAYFLAEAFDLLNVKYLVYTNSLSGEQRGKYAVLFDTDPSHRVLLMDIKQAAHGLNLSSASRVFFVNPVCRPNIEAQAIKRAHRIGQTRPVHVETLLLQGTIEEKMHERAAKMTNHEHLQAKTLEDDGAMARIIQEARILPLTPEESQGEGQMAKLRLPQQVFGRPGRGKELALASKLELELFGDEAEPRLQKKSRTSRPAKSGTGARKGKSTQRQADADTIMSDVSIRVQDQNTGPSTAQNTSAASAGYNSIFGGS